MLKQMKKKMQVKMMEMETIGEKMEGKGRKKLKKTKLEDKEEDEKKTKCKREEI